MNIGLSSKARKQLDTLPTSEGLKVARKLQALQINPLVGKPLTGKLKSFYSLRAWPYRIIYELAKKKHTITIHAIEHRQGAYK